MSIEAWCFQKILDVFDTILKSYLKHMDRPETLYWTLSSPKNLLAKRIQSTGDTVLSNIPLVYGDEAFPHGNIPPSTGWYETLPPPQ
ncbi:hypothetical protein RRG08_055712 [Elysia crispata]|uniref:Uncharacterized protein n=1 Tax=Elysia crispata TaxID=231223 RepID=A0AAE1AZQ5_9GAST|nr:hypothetical protein RRG08_055712 [Elysia crispata]